MNEDDLLIESREWMVAIIPVLADNYTYIVSRAGEAVIIDPPVVEPIMVACERQGLTISAILCTHHHADHTAGIDDLKSRVGCRVYGPENVSGVDVEVCDHDRLSLLGERVQVMFTPGHTAAHFSYYWPSAQWLFCGDSLFLGGCGRLFECSAEVLWKTLVKLRLLPDETLIFCGHEYTLDNYKFATELVPDWPPARMALQSVQQQRKEGKPTIPRRLGNEKKSNVFLCADQSSFLKAFNRQEVDPVQVFAELRKRKDHF